MRSRLDVLSAGWSVESPSERLFARALAGDSAALVARCATGPVDLRDLPRLAAVDPAGLDDVGRVELIQAFERARAVLDGAQQRALAAVVEATEAAGLDGDLARHEVGAALRLSPQTAWQRTRVAADLVRRLPVTLARLRAGDVSYWQAAHLAEAVRALPDSTAAAVEARVLARAGEQTLAETKRATARAIATADPAGAAERHEKAVRERAIERLPQPGAMEGWFVPLPAHTAQAAWAVLTRRARRLQRRIRRERGDDPGLDALRVDTLVAAILDPTSDLVDHAAGMTGRGTGATEHTAGMTGRPAGEADQPDGEAGGSDSEADQPDGEAGGSDRGREATAWWTHIGAAPRCRCGGAQTAAVVIDLPTLFGLAERPGELPGYGPVPASVARELAWDRDWVRWVTEPGQGRLLDRGGGKYRPTDRLRRFVAAAHGRCGFPGCSQPADRCDTDHRVTFRRGGRTIRVNLGPLCRAHHNAKTHGRWRVRLDDGTGCLTWTSPLGKTYTKSIDPILE